MENIYGVILAGGSGSRLWPMSRELYPKQLLKITSDKSLLQSTFKRLNDSIDENKILTVTNAKHFSDIKIQLQELSDNQIKVITEPSSKNTAPAIAATVDYIVKNDDADPVILVVPADHLIENTANFTSTVKKGYELAQKGYIVTFGITPSEPETGYGYIDTIQADLGIESSLKVKEFKEKPNIETAKQYIEKGSYYWNSGIFMFKASVMMEEIKEHAADIYENLDNIEYSGTIPTINFGGYEHMPSISIDYAVMEKSKNIVLLPLESDWNDLGSWQSIYDISKKDENNNVISGNVINVGSKNSLISSKSKLIASVGLKNIVLVETEDAILACDKNKTQDVKKVFDELKTTNNDLHKIHKTVFRPWGFYTCVEGGDDYLIKTIQVNPMQKLSIQSHNHRSEHWVVLSGTATVILEDAIHTLSPGQSIDIPIKAKHSLQNLTDDMVRIIEVQKGNHICEDDIIRYEDMYGRA